jgi:DNA repair photolyase
LLPVTGDKEIKQNERKNSLNVPLIPAKTIVSGYSDYGWFGANYNMNIYKGCCHGCIYCDSRSDCYRVENFDTVRAKENALFVIRRDFESKKKPGVVMTGSMSDPYNPHEQQEGLTRGALELIHRSHFGVGILTKSALVCRDTDILLKIKAHSPVFVNMTVTTADDTLCEMIERYVNVTSARSKAIQTLSEAGIMCGVLLMPTLPFINDDEPNIREIVRMAAKAGAKWVYHGEDGFGVTLRQNQRAYFYDRLDALFPGVKDKYVRAFGDSYGCMSPNSAVLHRAFQEECEKYGLLYRMSDIVKRIRDGYQKEQLSLF